MSRGVWGEERRHSEASAWGGSCRHSKGGKRVEMMLPCREGPG